MTFINHGLVGVGRISASAIDKWGETLGSVSGFQLTGFTRAGPLAYSGTFHILPDRGYNSAPNFSNYAARIQKVDFTFRPEQGGASQGPTMAQDQFTFTHDPNGSVRFTCTTADGMALTAPRRDGHGEQHLREVGRHGAHSDHGAGQPEQFLSLCRPRQ